MSIVGSFPGIQHEVNRRTIRGPVNPLDKSTIVSIYPKDITETKPTITPGIFNILSGSFENPSILVVGPSSWWKEVDEHQPLLEIPISSIQIANAFVMDYCNGVYGCDMANAMPGIFYIPGELNINDIKTKYKTELTRAQQKQKNFYSTLIKIADSLWARSNGNPLAISDDMRMAARELGVTTKDWLKDFQAVGMTQCYACGSLKRPDFPVCATCHAIDPLHPKAKEIKFVV